MANRSIVGDDYKKYPIVYNLKLVRDSSNNNKLVIRCASLDATPDQWNPIRVQIQDGNGVSLRKRGATYLDGTYSITLVDGTAYWNKVSINNSLYYGFLYAIWDGTGIIFALGGHPNLLNVSTTTTVTDADYLLLEDSTTYSRNSAHFCTAIAEVAYEYDTADTPDYTISTSKFRIFPVSYSNTNDIVTEYRRFNSDYTIIYASGTKSDLDAITATKSDPGGVILAVTFNRPPSVRYLSIKHVYLSSETSGKTQVSFIFPEPHGETTELKSIRPIGYRLNSAMGVVATGGTINNDSGTLTLYMTSFTAGQDYGLLVIF
jgi:hypothetical protein